MARFATPSQPPRGLEDRFMATDEHPRNHGVALAAPAEDLCLAYVNTRYWRGRAEPTETLCNFDDVLIWLERHSGSAPPLLSRARERARDHRAAVARAGREAIALRETIYRIFTAIAVGESVMAKDLDQLNHALALTPPRLRLIRGTKGFGWAANEAIPTVPALLAPVLWSAADLLTYADNRRLRRCANEECLWLFMDHSKGGTRRWCDMNSCGNRAKAKRHYARAKRPSP
jgi:predicted RNA-binding Zn ribbon-like protein